MKLILGVVDLPYSEGDSTTGEVAQRLEDDYGIMGFFVDTHAQDIANALESSLSGALDTMLRGGQVNDPLADATGEIEHQFRSFLDNKEMDGRVSGVATKRSIVGKYSRGKKNRPGRPSFIDTGLYQQSFKTWSQS